MDKTMLKKYARLTAVTGINVQKGQGVVIYASVSQEEFVCAIASECYKAGAGWVDVEWSSQDFTKAKLRGESLKMLCQVPGWQKEKYQVLVDQLPATIHILSEDPDGLRGVNQEKLHKSTLAQRKVRKFYLDQTDNKQQWTIVAAPSVKWAKKVFPKERASAAKAKLWDAILETVRVTKDNDPISAWEQHNAGLRERCDKLNAMKLKELRYKSTNGTDFTVGLISGALWLGGEESTISGVRYNPNLPTEEIFTTPMRGRAEGTVVSTKPLSYRGQLIENFSITFQNGKVSAVQAERGEEVLCDMIHSDDNAAFLGEVALIPKNSPISESGILFYETLFDENSSCHLALGAGFNNTIPSFETMTPEALEKVGVNDSVIHVDFMIGSEDLEITGFSEDGKTYTIFREGNWAF